ncbi:molybdopterin molybdotransferase MoeA [Afipia clevelandensis]|uniref:Molybdopterin molybdenumtransferase n=1 Tax=Afipia clevelandensis ATCC 49720 TaxID=883079 RepID=K8PFK3_9BRAD|nr:gephyrin-like molybdotransferase Glp [Afipia clevelandensis]EKS40316.1 molybdenum cofactor synthesis domain-containing protein [Afipia clevelandensis ATCC 49720]
MALMPVADAYAAVLKDAAALPEEAVALAGAYHRTLSRDIAALRTQPPAAMSAMDGYAVRASDAVTGARLKVIGEVAAGRPFNSIVGMGQAARIFTGGVIPDGADAVVIQEDTARDGDIVIVNEAIAAGKNIRAAGIDFKEGDVLLPRGTRLNDRALALAAGMDHPRLPVHRRARVAILATGDELMAPGSALAPGQIVYSNIFSLSALVESESAEVIDLGIARDTLESTTDGIRRARDSGADVLVTTGGASVGDHDLVQTALMAEGVDMAFWKIALRPGKPMMHGRLGAMRVLGLPGNPVSSYVCAFLFLVPLIRALSGRTVVDHPLEKAVLGRDMPANDQRQDYLRARLASGADGLPVATPVNAQDSSLVASLAAASALIIRPPFAPAAAAGSPCTILRLPD